MKGNKYTKSLNFASDYGQYLTFFKSMNFNTFYDHSSAVWFKYS